MPTRTANPRTHTSQRTPVVDETLEKFREPDGRSGHAHQADHTPPYVIRRSHRT
ncbi:hypothetical protein [Streptomyces sp. NPDC058295]|uniref:hypothetical protein n=1 Tax=Streptomyces sp. NPDC058295 TaxID=3346431 RepID=UPI0036EC5FBC